MIKILGATLEDNDPRWLAFGLNMPATNSTPGQPLNLAAHPDDTGAIVVQCDAVPLATRYRWRMLMVGVQPDCQLAASSKEPMAAITDVLPGQTVKILVQAVNGNLQGVTSDVLVFTLPAAMPAAASKRAEETPAVNEAPSENGHGHLRHARVA